MRSLHPRRAGAIAAALATSAALASAGTAHAATGITVLEKIKYCESGGNYRVQNPTSTASGAYQFVNATWRSLSASAGYSTAASAPASVQDKAAIELYHQSGTSPWNASKSCWGSLNSVPGTSSTSASSSTSTSSTSASSSASSSTRSSASTSTGSTATKSTTTKTNADRSTATSTTKKATAKKSTAKKAPKKAGTKVTLPKRTGKAHPNRPAPTTPRPAATR